MMNKAHQGETLVELPTKRVGVDRIVVQPIGARCRVQRNQACLGEFIIWFSGKYYAKINAIELPNKVHLLTGGL